jgi:hypothetical protein
MHHFQVRQLFIVSPCLKVRCVSCFNVEESVVVTTKEQTINQAYVAAA